MDVISDRPRSSPAGDRDRNPRTLLIRWIFVPLLAVHLVHASNYLYFFTDDEGIPFMYAQRLLSGEGLAYNSFEGRVEGYSNFLYVLLGTTWLAAVRAIGWDPIAVFFIGQSVSLLASTAALWLIWRALRRESSVKPSAAAAAVGFLALAPPIAAWSGSAAEMTLVLLLAAIVPVALMAGTRRLEWGAASAATALVLLRIDGLLYAAALIAPWVLFAGSERRTGLLRRVVLPVALAAVVYHAARFWYFGDLLTTPIYSKVLYKLTRPENIVVKVPDVSYAAAFLGVYGLLPATISLGTLIVACRRHRTSLVLLLSAVLLMAYAAVVGDWMLGFRFFLPALPPLALALAHGLSALPRRLAAALTGVLLVWFGWAAIAYAHAYEALPDRESWLRSPSFEPRRFFGPYYAVFDELRREVQPGDRVAYNQAGFVPFMLGADNLDDLGICSKFVAKLPTTDVLYTEVGRYSPLTNSRALRAANAYLLYRNPELIVASGKDLRVANGGRIPREILRRQYRLRRVLPGHQAVYQRAASPTDALRIAPELFLENLAHPSRVFHASRDGAEMRRDEYLARLRALTGSRQTLRLNGRTQIRVVFARSDLPVFEINIGELRSSHRGTLRVVLRSRDGRAVSRRRDLPTSPPRPVDFVFDDPAPASEITLELDLDDAAEGTVRISDLRVQGQSPELASYVRQLPWSDNSATLEK